MIYSNFIKTSKAQLLIICLLTFLVYSNTLSSGFAIDDHLFVVDWQVTKDLKNIPLMFTKEFAPGLGEHNGVYRPLRTVFYSLSYAIWGTNPSLYHFQALMVHLAITTLIYFFTKQLLQSKKNILPFVVALLFGFHPIHTEAISYITASFDSIAYIFFFSSFLLYLKASSKLPIKKREYVISLVMAALTFFTLEMTLVLPLLIGLYDLLFKRKVNLKYLTPYFFLAAFYLFIRIGVFHITSRAEYLGGSIALTMLTMVQAWVRYMELLIWPVNLSINPTIAPGINSWVGEATRMDKILGQSVTSPQVILSIVVIVTLLIVAWKLRKKLPLITFSVLWFFICLLPVSYIIPQGPIMQERYIYLASFGYILLLAFFIEILGDWGNKDSKGNRGKIVSLGLILLLSFYSYQTFSRNKDWESGISIWFSLIKQIPDDPYTNLVIGTYYEQNNNLEQASSYYQNALKNKPDYQPAYQRLLEINAKKSHVN